MSDSGRSLAETKTLDVVVHVSRDDCEAPVFLAWKDLSVTVRRHKRPLLNKVTGKITTGFYAIMVSARFGLPSFGLGPL